MLEAAITYARRGWRVLPLHGWTGTCCTCGNIHCASPGKHPRTTNGLSGASSNPATIRMWFERWPEANIGLVTGEHFDVLDVDGPDGEESLRQLLHDFELPSTLIVRTGGGGFHYLFEPTGAGNRAKMRPGLDWRGKGGYIVAPPSLHPSGDRYTKLWGDVIYPAPDWLVNLVAPKPSVRPAETSEWLQGSASPEYGQRALEAELATLAMAQQGERNHALNRAAFSLFQLVKANLLDVAKVQEELMRVGQEIGLSTVEIGRTMQSAYKSAEPRVIEATQWTEPTRTPVLTAPKFGVTMADQITPRRTRWLWDGRLPQGSLSLIGGREGIGKSTAAYDLAASLTRGVLPGEFLGQPKGVLIAAYEDDWPRTIVPRLMAAGADLTKVGRIDVYEDGGLTLPRDIEAVRQAIADNDIALVLLDPLMSRLGDRDTHKDSEVRQSLEPMAAMAQTAGCSVLGVIHVNKSGSSDPLTTLMGSRAFAAVARSVLFVFVDPDNDGQRILALAKNNLGRMDIPSLPFVIEDRVIGQDPEDGKDIHSGKVCWQDEVMIDIHEAMSAANSSHEEKTVRGEVAGWLVDLLKANSGMLPSKEVKSAARKEGYSLSTLNNVRTRLKIEAQRLPGFQAETIWKLPEELRTATLIERAAITSEWLEAEDDD